MFMLKMKIKADYYLNSYKLRHWFFSWQQDEDGDIVFSVAKVLHFTKYKEHTVVKFGRVAYQPAPKHVRGAA